MALDNVDGGYDGTDVSWDLIGQLFYVSERVDTITQRVLNHHDYSEFKRDLVMKLTEKLETLFGENLTERQWRIFVLTQTMDKIEIMKTLECMKQRKNNGVDMLSWGLGVLTAIVLNKLI